MKEEKEEFTPTSNEGIQLNKFLSNSGIASRRNCAEFIKNGLVKVNGKEEKSPGYRVQPTDVVSYRDKKIESGKKFYILLNKPKDFITTTSDERGRKTVMELIQQATDQRVFPVGRLDRNTTGLLLFTNDGELTQHLTHPSNKVKKVYEVTLDKDLSMEDMEKIAKGVELEDGLASADEIAYAHPTENSVVGIELHSGKNRIVRRIFESLGYEVLKLDRVRYGILTKKDLPRGKWRLLSTYELNMLRRKI